MRLNARCVYCNEPVDELAGNPGLWPLMFSDDDTGVVKPHHVGCVQERLRELAQAKAELAKYKDSRPSYFGCACRFDDEENQTKWCAHHAALRDELVALRAECERLRENRDGLQARIDELILEYCPDEMTEQQLEEYEKNQIAVALDRKDQP